MKDYKNSFLYLHFQSFTNENKCCSLFSKHRYMQKIIKDCVTHLNLFYCEKSRDLNNHHFERDLERSLYEVSYCFLLNESFYYQDYQVSYDTPNIQRKRPDFIFPDHKLLLEVKSDIIDQEKLISEYEKFVQFI